MLSLADIATQLNVCKTLALALPRFYKRTGISAQFSFVYNNNEFKLNLMNLIFKKIILTQKNYDYK